MEILITFVIGLVIGAVAALQGMERAREEKKIFKIKLVAEKGNLFS